MTGRGTILAGLAAASLYVGASVAAMAQTAGDPPDQAGRLAEMSGTVSFHTADDSQWSAATLNYPITNGNSLWTEPRSHAAVDVGSSRIYMDSSTELDVGTIDDQHFIASLPQGAVYARVNAGAGIQYEIDTPRGQVQIGQQGAYEVVAGNADHPTVVTVYEGSAQVSGPAGNLSLGPGEAASISGQDNQLQASTGQAAPPDDFIRFVQEEERPYANQPPQQYASPEMTGYQDLAQNGTWQSTPDYGPVWYPQVAAGWAPYRYGHWAYVWPWGWTWIDDARWGFAPFHYGRWVDYGGRWGWVPGAYEQAPVYSPALVAFFGNIGGIGIGLAIGQAVGWVPLGPGEICYPGYRASPEYLRRMNGAYIHNTTVINYNYYNTPHGSDYSHYENHLHGATVVSSDAMVHSRPISQAWKQMPQAGSTQYWQHAKSYVGQAPVKPSYATVGVTPGNAHRIGLAATTTPAVTHAPGPQIQKRKVFGTAGQGTTTFAAPANNGSKIKGATVLPPTTTNNASTTHVYKGTAAPGPAITPNNGNGIQNGQAGTNKTKTPKTYGTVAPGPAITTNNGNGAQNGQTGGNTQKAPKTYNLQTGTVNPNATSGQQRNNQQNGHIQPGNSEPHNYNNAGTQGAGQSVNGHIVKSGTPPKLPPPPPPKNPPPPKCQAGQKCS